MKWSTEQDRHGNWIIFRGDDAQAVGANESIAACIAKCMQVFEDECEAEQSDNVIPFRGKR